MNGKLNEACKKQHEAIVKKGFTGQSIATKLMLIVSELSEALEADRKNKHADLSAFESAKPELHAPVINGRMRIPNVIKEECKLVFEAHIKDTFEDELADAFLRLMDLCGEYNIDIEKHIRLKAAYNELRPYKHGKAY